MGRTLVVVALSLLVGAGVAMLVTRSDDERVESIPSGEEQALEPGSPADSGAAREGEPLWHEPVEGRSGSKHSRFAILAKQISPGVVNIQTSKTDPSARPLQLPHPGSLSRSSSSAPVRLRSRRPRPPAPAHSASRASAPAS